MSVENSICSICWSKDFQILKPVKLRKFSALELNIEFYECWWFFTHEEVHSSKMTEASCSCIWVWKVAFALLVVQGTSRSSSRFLCCNKPCCAWYKLFDLLTAISESYAAFCYKILGMRTILPWFPQLPLIAIFFFFFSFDVRAQSKIVWKRKVSVRWRNVCFCRFTGSPARSMAPCHNEGRNSKLAAQMAINNSKSSNGIKANTGIWFWCICHGYYEVTVVKNDTQSILYSSRHHHCSTLKLYTHVTNPVCYTAFCPPPP